MPRREVGLDVEVGEEDKEDESMGKHVVRELQRERTIVIEDLKKFKFIIQPLESQSKETLIIVFTLS